MSRGFSGLVLLLLPRLLALRTVPFLLKFSNALSSRQLAVPAVAARGRGAPALLRDAVFLLTFSLSVCAFPRQSTGSHENGTQRWDLVFTRYYKHFCSVTSYTLW